MTSLVTNRCSATTIGSSRCKLNESRHLHSRVEGLVPQGPRAPDPGIRARLARLRVARLAERSTARYAAPRQGWRRLHRLLREALGYEVRDGRRGGCRAVDRDR